MTNQPATKCAVIYTRSGDHADLAPEQQASMCRAMARRFGATIEAVFTDELALGDRLGRPGIRALMAHTAKHRTAFVICANQSHFSSDRARLVSLLCELHESGTVLAIAHSDMLFRVEPEKLIATSEAGGHDV